MEISRNRYFLAGMLLILLGLQFRLVQSFVLNESATRTLIRVSKSNPVTASESSALGNFIRDIAVPRPKKQVEPPRWLGLALVAIGAVVSLHAVALPKEG
ncbi:MAG: hypothetical protein EA381_00910 [Planctomycetaceae bacterium]|jgi:hypothetical protein|nr:MAG: hypothetical protein EA381_00910 [Planctomycetaceae bacterium]